MKIFIYLLLLLAISSSLFSKTITVRTSKKSDAAEQIGTKVYTKSKDLDLVYSNYNEQLVGVRFKKIKIPKKSKIISAYIQFTADNIVGKEDKQATSIYIDANYVNSARTFSDHKPIKGRALTSLAAQVQWDIPAWSITEERGKKQKTPDLSVMIQEIIDRPKWKSGNHMAFIFSAGPSCIDETCHRTAETHKNDNSSPTLVIEFVDDEPPVITPANFTVDIRKKVNDVVYLLDIVPTPKTVTILSGNGEHFFKVDNFGVISVANTLENNSTTLYTLTIEASNDYGSTTEDIQVTLVDDIPLSTELVNTRDFDNVPILDKNSITINGSILQIGNQLLCLNGAGNGSGGADGNECLAPTEETTNGNWYQYRVKADANATIFNSMAKLEFEPGDEIVFARLYWSARIRNVTQKQIESARYISMKGPQSSTYSEFMTLNSKYNWHESGSVFDYGASVDVLEYVKANRDGEYYVGNIVSDSGFTNTYASWQLIVVVKNPTRSLKNIAIYDGFYSIYGQSNDYPDSVTVRADGFITPTGTQPFDANLFIYVGESDYGYSDSTEVKNGAGNFVHLVDGVNDVNEVMNASVYSLDYSGGYRSNVPGMATPNFRNVLGVDIDKIQINNKYDTSKQTLSNSQTSTEIRITSGTDRYSLNMFAFETEVFVPEFCYDYAYKQQNRYFTEPNNGLQNPKLTGSVITGKPINMSIYLKSRVDGTIQIQNMEIDVLDINRTQATYINDSTRLIKIGDLTQEEPSHSPSTIGNEDFINDIDVGVLDENDYFYLYYSLNPKSSTIDMPIYITATYDLVLDSTVVSYNLTLSKEIPLCTDNNFEYTPRIGIFNIVHNDYYDYDMGGTNRYYNLPTQVTSREGAFKVISLDANNTDELNPISTVVSVEMIDVSAFHDTEASCQELNSSISERVWMIFDANATSVMFDENAINFAINNVSTQLNSSDQFYEKAREKAAFRVSYNNLNAHHNGLLKVSPGKKLGTYNIDFPDLFQLFGSDCSQTVVYDKAKNKTTNKIPVACANNSDVTPEQLQACMECIYGFDTQFICSRDNFSIRPEALLVKLSDQNQTDITKRTKLADNVSGVTDPNGEILNLASGYNYILEVNATNHLNNAASTGYTKSFNVANPSDKSAYSWSPRDAHIITGCNDTNDSLAVIRFLEGIVDTNTSINQVGEYTLGMRDTTWTAVDSDPLLMAHHVGVYFLPLSTKDCIPNVSTTQVVNSTLVSVNQPRIGCVISSEHDSSDIVSNLKYRDYNVTFHPYKFDLTGIAASSGLNNNLVSTDSYIYMSDMSNPQDENMSFHLNGPIVALGYNNTRLTNFVNSCYAKGLDLNITKSDTTHLNNRNEQVVFQSRFHSLDTNGTVVTALDVDTNDTTPLQSLLIHTTPLQFQKSLNGLLNTRLNLNYNRLKDRAANPKVIHYGDYNVSCTDAVHNCQFSADMITTKTTEGNISVDANITHYYARNHSPRYRFSDNNGTAYIYYEVYCSGIGCDKTVLQNGTTSQNTDDPRWFINSLHNSSYGSAREITQKDNTLVTGTKATGNHQDTTFILYSGSNGYPYKTTMETNSSNWLIFNKYDSNATKNSFEVEFVHSNSSWAGIHETESNTNTTATDKTNRRSMW